mgnify:CR=1 FL=1
MATAMKKCKVCGKDYPYCKTVVKAGVFRYQDVACCPEHGSIYLARVQASRAGTTIAEKPTEIAESTFDELHTMIVAEMDTMNDEDALDEDLDDDVEESVFK